MSNKVVSFFFFFGVCTKTLCTLFFFSTTSIDYYGCVCMWKGGNGKGRDVFFYHHYIASIFESRSGHRAWHRYETMIYMEHDQRIFYKWLLQPATSIWNPYVLMMMMMMILWFFFLHQTTNQVSNRPTEKKYLEKNRSELKKKKKDWMSPMTGFNTLTNTQTANHIYKFCWSCDKMCVCVCVVIAEDEGAQFRLPTFIVHSSNKNI